MIDHMLTIIHHGLLIKKSLINPLKVNSLPGSVGGINQIEAAIDLESKPVHHVPGRFHHDPDVWVCGVADPVCPVVFEWCAVVD